MTVASSSTMVHSGGVAGRRAISPQPKLATLPHVAYWAFLLLLPQGAPWLANVDPLCGREIANS